jgi:hypothetical protein
LKFYAAVATFNWRKEHFASRQPVHNIVGVIAAGSYPIGVAAWLKEMLKDRVPGGVATVREIGESPVTYSPAAKDKYIRPMELLDRRAHFSL